MGGSSKSGGGGSMMPPPQNIPSGFANTGMNMPQNPNTLGRASTGNGTQAPDWMSGWFAAPWWGQPAPNVGAAIQQQLNPQAYNEMLKLQQKRGMPKGGGRKKPPPKQQQQNLPPDMSGGYQGPDPAGPSGFLSYGSFGGRQR